MKEWLKRTKANIILVALLTMILGLVLILWPTSSTMFICLLSGWLLLLGGILSIILYFSAPQTGPNAGLFLGLVVSALGLWTVIRPGTVVQFLSVLFGIILLIHGFLNVQDSIELKRSALCRLVGIPPVRRDHDHARHLCHLGAAGFGFRDGDHLRRLAAF